MALHIEGLAMSLLVVVLVFLIFSWMVVALRLGVRIWIKGVGYDDYFIISGLLLYTVCCISTTLAVYNGVGTHANRLNAYYEIEGKKWFTMFQLFYALAAIAIKCGICLGLLRIAHRPRYRWPIYIAMFLATLSTTIGFFTILGWCKPIAANWDATLGTCANASIVTNISFFISASAILTDWTCAILPAFILWEIQLNRRTKITVVFVLALGVVASISTIVRLKFLLNYNSVSDYLYGVANIALWSVVELGSGLIAGSMATLRPLFKFIPFLRSSRSGSGKGASAPHGYGNRSHKLETFGTGRGTNPGYRTLTEGGKSEERGSDGDSQRHILKETEVTITTDELSSVPQTGHVGMAYSGNTAMIQGNEDIMVSDPEHGYPRHGARH